MKKYDLLSIMQVLSVLGPRSPHNFKMQSKIKKNPYIYIYILLFVEVVMVDKSLVCCLI